MITAKQLRIAILLASLMGLFAVTTSSFADDTCEPMPADPGITQ